MKYGFKLAAAAVLGFASTVNAAQLKSLVTHNLTNSQSNAYVNGDIPSPYPTNPHGRGEVYWNMIKLACFSHTKDDICTAMIKMDTNTDHPLELGTVSMNLKTGEITPSHLTANGYTFTVNGIIDNSVDVTLTAN